MSTTTAGRPGADPPGEPRADERIPPRDFDAEQAVLGSVLIEPEATDRALRIVGPDDFYWVNHQVIMRAMAICVGRHEPVDLITVSAELRRQEKLDKVGGGPYLTSLIGVVPTAAHVVRYANIVAEKAALRSMINAGQRIQDIAFHNPEDVGAALAEAEAELTPIAGRLCRPSPPALRNGQDIVQTGSSTRWLWPSWLLDGQLNVLIAPPDAGKTYAALGLVAPVLAGIPWPDGEPYSSATGPVLFLDYEGFEDVIVERAGAMGISLDMLLFAPVEVTCFLNEPRAEQVIAEWVERAQVRAIVVDSWREAIPGEDEDSSQSSQFARKLARIAHHFSITVLLIHHTRKVARNNRWQLSQDDARGSSALSAVARVVLGIEKTDAKSEVRRLRVLKSNRGARPEPIGFTIGDHGICWTEPPASGRRAEAYDRCVTAVRMAIEQNGPMTYSDLFSVAAEAKVSESTLIRVLKPEESKPAICGKGPDEKWYLLDQAPARPVVCCTALTSTSYG
ncbi:MAG: AAA family ATPase [Armatimonadetes bacterium]|nr:AAA family ATPase [Armatimonadota bacterium]